MPPKTVGHYQIDRELGHGQNGTVYLACDMRLDRRVALKVFDRSGEGAWGEALEEARLSSVLDHPHISTIYDVGEAEADDRSLPYIAMEYVEGRSLAEALEDGPLDRLMVHRYATQLCEALAYAHERGVVHGDVKASNVLITPDAEAKWVDFGSAVRSRRPEAVSAQADIWKMGILLYQMATGKTRRPPLPAVLLPRWRCPARYPAISRPSSIDAWITARTGPTVRRGTFWKTCARKRTRRPAPPRARTRRSSLGPSSSCGWRSRRCFRLVHSSAQRLPPTASARRFAFRFGMARAAPRGCLRRQQANPPGRQPRRQGVGKRTQHEVPLPRLALVRAHLGRTILEARGRAESRLRPGVRHALPLGSPAMECGSEAAAVEFERKAVAGATALQGAATTRDCTVKLRVPLSLDNHRRCRGTACRPRRVTRPTRVGQALPLQN